MARVRSISALVLTAIIFIFSFLFSTSFAFGQEAPEAKMELLLVDEIKGFISSLQVEVLARAIKRTGMFNLTAKLVEVKHILDFPLGKNPDEKRYDIILIVPKALEDGLIRQVWIVTLPRRCDRSSRVWEAVGLLSTLVEGIYRGAAEAVDVTEDLIVALFSTLAQRNGWLK